MGHFLRIYGIINHHTPGVWTDHGIFGFNCQWQRLKGIDTTITYSYQYSVVVSNNPILHQYVSVGSSIVDISP